MAGARGCATFSVAFPPSLTTPNRFGLLPPRAFAIAIPSKPPKKKRKNHLRPKIPKTITKTFPTAPLPEIAAPPPPPLDDVVFDSPSQKVEDFIVSERESVVGSSSLQPSGSFGKFSPKAVLKVFACFLGVFVVQTICALWVFGNTKKDESFDSLDGKGAVSVNGGVKLGMRLANLGSFDESEMEERINEIRTMAREAREMERRERQEGGGKESDIEKEIGARLVKLEKRLNSKREKLPESIMRSLGMLGDGEEEGAFSDDDDDEEEEEEEEEDLDLKEEKIKALMFKKKFRFRSPSVNARSDVRGFSGSKDRQGRSARNGESRTSALGSMNANGESEAMSAKFNSVKNDGKKLDEERRSGAVQVDGEGKSSGGVSESGKSTEFRTQNSQNLKKEIQETAGVLNGHASFSKNGSINLGPVMDKVGGKGSEVKTNLWWLKLPYVFAIFMRRDSEPERPGGLYTLRTGSPTDEQETSSFTLVFEDRTDANNFCYLLESFFEELGDFSADIIPLPTKELHEAVKLDSKKVIAVKKGQLKLYAGQPFSEVEIALHSLLEE